MKGKKSLFLFLALLLPVAVFVFLKMFGRNEFDVPPLYQDSVPAFTAGCPHRYELPYRIPDSVMNRFGANAGDSLYVIYFQSDLRNAVTRADVEFSRDRARSILVRQDEGTDFLRKCVLLMDDAVSIALLDGHGTIRGLYDGYDRDDVDRLIVEMKILLKKY